MPSIRERGDVAVPTASSSMTGTTRTRPTTRTPVTTTRRPTKTSTSVEDVGLADDLQRLQISQSKVSTSFRRPEVSKVSSEAVAPKSKGPPVRAVETVTKASSSANLRAGPSGSKSAASETPSVRQKVPVSTDKTESSRRASSQAQAGPSRLPATTRPNPASSSRRIPALSSIPDWTTDTSLSPSERAGKAVSSLNASQTAFSKATQAGYRLGRAVKSGDEDWSDERMQSLVSDSRAVLGVLRSMDERGELGKKGIEVERASMGLSQRCIGVSMYETALDLLAESRERIIRLYKPVEQTNTQSPSAESTESTFPKGWLELVKLPVASNLASLDESVRTILFQASIYAWISVIALRSKFKIRISQIFQLPSPHPSRSSILHPLDLAINLPIRTTSPLLNLFSRLASAIPTASSDWPVAIRLSYFCQALVIPPIPTTEFNGLWENLQTQLQARLQESSASAKDVEGILRDVVFWVEGMVVARKADQKIWFSGKAWIGLMDIWISLGRKLGDSTIIDEALSRMTGSTSINVPVNAEAGPSTPRSSTPPSQLTRPIPARSGSSRRAIEKLSDAENIVIRHCGELSALTVLLDEVLETPNDPTAATALQSALENFPLLPFGDGLVSLDNTDSGRSAFRKASRLLEIARRRCADVLKVSHTSKSSDVGGLAGGLHVWLIGEVDLVEDFVQTSPIELDTIIKDLTHLSNGAIMTLFDFFSHSISITSSTPTHTPRAYLDRIRRLTLLCRPFLPSPNYVDWVRAYGRAAHNYAKILFDSEKYGHALNYYKLSAEGANELLDHLGEVTPVERDEWRLEEIFNITTARWEYAGRCAAKLHDHETLATVNIAAISSISSTILTSLLSASSTKQYNDLWSTFPLVEALLRRVSVPILDNPLRASAFTTSLLKVSFRVPGEVGGNVKGLILEKWFEVLERGLHIPEIVQVAIRISEAVMEIYQADVMPIKRTRFMCRVLGVMLQTGVDAEKVPDMLAELDKLNQAKSFGQDAGLATSLPEYRATSLLLRALFAHRQGGPNSTSEVSSIAGKAMDELRQLIIPPSTLKSSATPGSPAQPKSIRTKLPLGRATTTPAPRTATRNTRAVSGTLTKTTKSRAPIPISLSESVPAPAPIQPITPQPTLADLPRLITLLSSLISLLGLLGLPLQKIEALKLARAFLRSNESLVGEYVTLSSRLGTEYASLGKWGRSTAVFNQARRVLEKGGVEDERKAEWGLRWAKVLAQMGKVDDARKEYDDALTLHKSLTPIKSGRMVIATIDRAGRYERAALARIAYAAILTAEGKTTLVLPHLAASYRLYNRYVEFIASLGPEVRPAQPTMIEDDDPFSAPTATPSSSKSGANQPAKDALKVAQPTVAILNERILSGIQWHATEALLGSIFDLAAVYSIRGSARDIDYYLLQAKEIGEAVGSPLVVARSEAKMGELEGRLRMFEASAGRLGIADGIFLNSDGPSAVESRVIHGDLLEKVDSAPEALIVFKKGGEDIEGLEDGFGKKEALLPTPERPATIVKSTSTPSRRDRLLPSTLAHVLRQRLWLGRNDGMGESEKAELVKQIQALDPSTSNKAEELYLNGRLALLEVLKVFKTDLFMSSLTDSTIAMPMSTLTRRNQDRHSTRRTVNTLLAKSAAAFHAALGLMEQDGRVEDVRQIGLSLALLHAFQTSLGEGGDGLARTAADLLASTSSITMRREMINVIKSKFVDGPLNDLQWPTFDNCLSPQPSDEDMSEEDSALRSAWTGISTRLQSPLLSSTTPIDLSVLPPTWAVVSISVASDHSTMFLSRHQKDHPPLVLCLPLDRQGKREGEDNPLPFQAALDELAEIIGENDEQARSAKNIETREGKAGWWESRHALDTRLAELVASMEANWLGAFKSILKPQLSITPKRIQSLRRKLEKIFNEALAGIGTDMRKVKTVRLDDAVLACFATLDGSTKEEEIEDLVYFVLDLYGFHGIPVAIAELDIDQVGVDVKQALHELDMSPPDTPPPSTVEHLFLALDKNVQGIPWESIPVLRGQPVSRIPSLPFLLDHLELARLTSPEKNGLLSVNARKVFYVLNPSGDLSRTQTHFEPWLDQMKERAGWKGIVGRPPTDMELGNALRDHDLVLYFGHGGAEQYIRSKTVRILPKCATTFLWGCSSGLLKDQGDLDRSGTAWNYMMAGCPSLIANLWDVTDRDIDRFSTEVHKKLGLDPAHLGSSTKPLPSTHQKSTMMGPLKRSLGQMTLSETPLLPLSQMSTVQALNASRDDCRLKYLTGAAPVVYGLPVWMF